VNISEKNFQKHVEGLPTGYDMFYAHIAYTKILYLLILICFWKSCETISPKFNKALTFVFD